MIKPNATRRFSMSLASLILIAAPIGCNSDTPAGPSAEAGEHMTAAPSPAAVDVDHAARAIDRDIRQTSGAVESEAGDVKGDAKRAVRETREGVKDVEGQIRGEAKETAEEVKGDVKQAVEGAKDDARKSADKALDDLLGSPKP